MYMLDKIQLDLGASQPRASSEIERMDT